LLKKIRPAAQLLSTGSHNKAPTTAS